MLQKVIFEASHSTKYRILRPSQCFPGYIKSDLQLKIDGGARKKKFTGLEDFEFIVR